MDDILNSNEVAQLLRVHLVTIYRYNKGGLLKPFQVKRHGRLQYTLKSIFDYFKGQRTMAELERDLMEIRERTKNRCKCEKEKNDLKNQARKSQGEAKTQATSEEVSEKINLFGIGAKPEKLFKIGEVIAYSGRSRQTIHNYTLAGLIHAVRRTDSGHRLYDESVFDRLEEIKKLQLNDYTLMQIKEFLESKRTNSTSKE